MILTYLVLVLLTCYIQCVLKLKKNNSGAKSLKTNATAWFKKMCEVKQLKPNYINAKINGQRPQDKMTKISAVRFRINREIQFLYRKKHNLNQQLYYLHLQGAHQYNGMWQHIQEYI